MEFDDLTALELYFADHFDTVLFPLLAEHYLLQGDFQRAHKVCEIGRDHHPDFVPGLFIEARTYLAEGEMKRSEKILKRIKTLDPGHYQTHVLLAEVATQLGRADSTLRRLYSRILEINSGDEKARAWLEKPLKKEIKLPPKKTTVKDDLVNLSISPQLATFTLMTILKSQKLYDQALEVLVVMSRKEGADMERIEQEREELLNLLKMQERIT